ncbi:MAG: hypothetical protein DHS20C18_28320 [Saprospiraceae bacterium]|nr:MAG: hypothetical protein DHS20C18_28320 [Saprospiraceae bacterium]
MANPGKEKKEKHFIQKPIYEGGIAAMKTFIREHLKYPQEALAKKIEGTVRVEYTINYKGVVTDAKVIAGISQACDQEAIRVVKLFLFKVPKIRKLKVVFHKTINIHFKLPKVKPQKKQQIQYTIIAKPPAKKDDKPASSGYNYSIDL